MKIQVSSWKSSSEGVWWELCRKVQVQSVLALLVASVGPQIVTGAEDERISGGQIPPEGKYPSLARLVSTEPSGENFTTCVLAILNRDWLVGPGNCFSTYSGPLLAEGLAVVVGDEITNETEPYEREHKVERFIIHERMDAYKGYKNEITGDDIAVVKVTPPIKFSNRVTPANLPSCKESEAGIVGLVAGYGARSEGIEKRYNHRLTEITNEIIPLDECSRFLGVPLDDRVFCVKAINNMSTCFLDNGAPFYHVKSDAQMVQLGFMSLWPDNASVCGFASAIVAVFTRFSSYVGWIHRRTSACGNHGWWNRTE